MENIEFEKALADPAFRAWIARTFPTDREGLGAACHWCKGSVGPEVLKWSISFLQSRSAEELRTIGLELESRKTRVPPQIVHKDERLDRLENQMVEALRLLEEIKKLLMDRCS